jgi:DNA (cytosine-5)-methyltransferase 1
MLVLSLFPGLGLLDHAFEAEGFCVVRGPDVIWGGDVRRFHPPAGVFDGIIGGDPCQSHSALANLVRAKGLEPSFPDMTPEFARVIAEAEPRWFLRENVPQAPGLHVEGYGIHSFLLDNCWLGEAQMRKRRFWFGVRDARPINLRKWIPGVALELPEQARCVSSELGRRLLQTGGEGIEAYRTKTQTVAGNDDAWPGWYKQAPVTGRHEGRVGSAEKNYAPPRRTLAEMCELQGLPPDYLDHCPFTEAGKRKAIGNGVAVPMGRAIAQAVRKAMA